MSIADQIRAEHSLLRAPQVSAGRELVEAVNVALAHARACRSLPAVLIVWVSQPGGHEAETWWWPDGRVEVRLNVGSDMSPRWAAAAALHEFLHVSEGPHGAARDHWAAEDRAWAFAAFVMREWPQAFDRLDGRPPSRR